MPQSGTAIGWIEIDAKEAHFRGRLTYLRGERGVSFLQRIRDGTPFLLCKWLASSCNWRCSGIRSKSELEHLPIVSGSMPLDRYVTGGFVLVVGGIEPSNFERRNYKSTIIKPVVRQTFPHHNKHQKFFWEEMSV